MSATTTGPSSKRRTTYWPRPHVEILIDADYPDYAVLEIGSAYVPVVLTLGYASDCFLVGDQAIRAFLSEDDAWELIAEDARVMGREPKPGEAQK